MVLRNRAHETGRSASEPGGNHLGGFVMCLRVPVRWHWGTSFVYKHQRCDLQQAEAETGVVEDLLTEGFWLYSYTSSELGSAVREWRSCLRTSN